jgi:hypothetical protein
MVCKFGVGSSPGSKKPDGDSDGSFIHQHHQRLLPSLLTSWYCQIIVELSIAQALILQAGAKKVSMMNLKSREGKTAVIMAADRGKIGLVTHLLIHDAILPMDQPDLIGSTCGPHYRAIQYHIMTHLRLTTKIRLDASDFPIGAPGHIVINYLYVDPPFEDRLPPVPPPAPPVLATTTTI